MNRSGWVMLGTGAVLGAGIVAAIVLIAAPTRAGSPSAAPTSADRQVYVTRTGKKYHLATCRYAAAATATTRAAAVAGGLQPCKVCEP